MKRYLSTKNIQAEPMDKYEFYRNVKEVDCEEHNEEGYLVRYKDGYISWSPKRIFEESCVKFEDGNNAILTILKDKETYDFGDMVRALKSGFKVAREGWNGKGMYVIYQKGYPAGVPANKNMAETGEVQEFELIKINPWLQIKCVDGTYSTWVPSINDVLAEDWEIVK